MEPRKRTLMGPLISGPAREVWLGGDMFKKAKPPAERPG